MPRMMKQLAYGILFLVVMAGVGAVIYFAFMAEPATCSDNRRNQGEEGVDCGGPCEEVCAADSLSIVISDKRQFALSDLGRTTFYVEFSNPNTDYWVRTFKYTINVYNPLGVKTASFSGISSIAPSGKRPIVIAAVGLDPRDVTRTDIAIVDPKWVSITEYHVDGVSLSNVSGRFADGKAVVSGTAVNNVSSAADNIIVSAVFKDIEGRPANASRTELGNLPPFSKKDFELFLTPDPLPRLDLSKTEVFTEVVRK